MVAQTHLEKKQYKSARKAYEKVLRELDKHDIYALCGTGNLCLRFALDDPNQRAVHTKRAVEFFGIALRSQPNCIPAAAGIAIAYAQSGHSQEAIEIFNQIQGSATSDRDVVLNTAHLLVILDKVPSAISLYESLLKKAEKPDPVVLSALARGHFILGRTNLDPVSMKKAREYVEKALEAAPGDQIHLFNLALVKQLSAQVLNQQPAERRHLRSIAALQEAFKDLEESEEIFNQLAEEKGHGYNPDQARQRAKFSSDLRRVTEKKIHEAETLERLREEKLAEMKLKQEEAERKAREEEEEERLRREQREAEIEMKRKEIQEKVREENEKMRIAIENEQTRERKRKEQSESEDETEEPK